MTQHDENQEIVSPTPSREERTACDTMQDGRDFHEMKMKDNNSREKCGHEKGAATPPQIEKNKGQKD